jgi:hypothetical protein
MAEATLHKRPAGKLVPCPHSCLPRRPRSDLGGGASGHRPEATDLDERLPRKHSWGDSTGAAERLFYGWRLLAVDSERPRRGTWTGQNERQPSPALTLGCVAEHPREGWR